MRSSTGRSRAGSAGAAPAQGSLLDGFERGAFPATLYVDGASEPLKAAFLAELRAAWARHVPAAPAARVLRAAEAGIDAILAAYHGGSLFNPRDLTVVLEIEDLGRSEKKLDALAAGLARPSGGACLVLVESAADAPRKSLAALRAACAARWTALPPGRRELIAWGQRRIARAGLTAEPGLIEALADASEGDPLAFFSELPKLETLATAGKVGKAELALLLRPAVDADLPAYLAAVAMGDGGRAARSLGRLLATGVSGGTVLFSLSNLVSGALGGWSRHAALSEALRRRRPPRELSAALDALYRAEAAWKGGRADVVAVLEQATRVTSGS
jgi:DNA polymerase III delta subunit